MKFRDKLLVLPSEQMMNVVDYGEIFVRTLLYHKIRRHILHDISITKQFSPPIPLAFGHLPYTDDRNYRPHLQLIYP